MRSLPRAAQIYLMGVYLVGVVSTLWLTVGEWETPGYQALLLTALLGALAAAAQVFVVARAKANYSDHLTPAPVFAALLLLPSPLLAAVVAVTFIPEWIRFKRPWFIQTFNILSWMIAAFAGRMTLASVGGDSYLHHLEPLSPSSIALSIPAFLGVQTVLLALVLRFARNKSFKDSGLFLPTKLFCEIALICSGWAFAAAWILDPFYALPAILPLLIIFQALHVPNLKEEASTDAKTGLLNMRHFNELMNREFERSERNTHVFSMLMCDLDYLRNINNTYGHQAGDVVLLGVADSIRSCIRPKDIAARFGGEEFIILLPEADAATAREIAERIRVDFADNRFDIGADHDLISGSVSIGVATYPTDGRAIEALVREADLALYQAKREGRNRVIVANRQSRELVGEWAREHLVTQAGDGKLAAVTPTSRTLPESANLNRATTGEGDAARPDAVPEAAGAGAPSSPSAPAKVATGIPPRIKALISGVLIAALAAQIPAFLFGWSLGSISPVGLVMVLGLVILAQHLAIDIDGKGKTSVAVVPILGAGFLYGGVGSVAAAAVFALWAMARAKSPIHRMLFNFGNALLGGTAAVFTLQGFAAVLPGSNTFEILVVPAAVAGLVYYSVNHVLMCTVRSIVEDRSLVDIWKSDYRWLWPHYAVLGALALFLAYGYTEFGWTGVLALCVPIAMMHLAIRQYMGHMTVHVADLHQINSRLTDSYEATLQALTRALDTRDEETEEHSQRVKRYAELIARHLGLSDDEIEHLSRGALLHDIGKIGVPDAILLKPGYLTVEERDLMRRHPTIGFTMIAHIPFLSKASEIVLHHHESYDGTGYPSGLSGDKIPLGARIFAVADTLDAMTSDRPYRQAQSVELAIEEIRRCSGTQFDPTIVAVLDTITVEDIIACGDVTTAPGPDIRLRETMPERIAV